MDAYLDGMKAILPEVPRGHLFYRDPEEKMFSAAEAVGAFFVMPEKGHVSAGLVKNARDRHLGVATWVCDDPEEFVKLQALDLLGIGTNRPGVMVEAVQAALAGTPSP